MDFVLSQILLSSSNVRTVSLIAPTGMLRRFKMREDVNLLLGTREMGELVKAANAAASSFYRFLPKLGSLGYTYLDFEDLHALIFPMPDRNVLLVTVEKIEPEIPRVTAFITRLLEHEGMIHAS